MTVVQQADFGTTPEGDTVEVYTLTNSNGMEMRCMTYGGIILSLRVPDRNGRLEDIVLGYDTLQDYWKDSSTYFGALIGRYGNRISKGKFTLNDDGNTYRLATNNNGVHHLHGGIQGFHKQIWKAESFQGKDSVGVIFRYTSEDGEEGYPGEVSVQVTYTIPKNENKVIIDYHATTTKTTPINLTQHSYFHLGGSGGDVLNHTVFINADKFLPVDTTLIPTGEERNVVGTPFDFVTRPTNIGERIDADDEQLEAGGGYDHCFVLNKNQGDDELSLVARVHEPKSGRLLTVHSTEPAVQFYTGNFLNNQRGKGGRVYHRRSGFCLETQHFPDSPNQPSFPSTLLQPGETFQSQTIFAFSVK